MQTQTESTQKQKHTENKLDDLLDSILEDSHVEDEGGEGGVLVTLITLTVMAHC